MNNRTISAIAFAVLTMAATGPGYAQVQPMPGQPMPGQPMQGQPIQAPPYGYQQGCPPRVTPSAQMLDERYMRRFSPLGLMPGQQQRIQSMVDAFSRMHPAGSPLDPTAMRQLHDEVRSVLTQQQLALLEQEHHGQGGQRRCQ
jgi:hypothetical protein